MAVTDRSTTLPPSGADQEPPVSERKRPSALRRFWPQYVAVAPFYVLFLIFGLFPIVFSIYLSFTDWDGMGERTFVGLAQYQYLISDPKFWNAVSNTFIIWFLSTIPMLFFALVLAFLLHQNIRFKGVYRVATSCPMSPQWWRWRSSSAPCSPTASGWSTQP